MGLFEHCEIILKQEGLIDGKTLGQISADCLERIFASDKTKDWIAKNEDGWKQSLTLLNRTQKWKESKEEMEAKRLKVHRIYGKLHLAQRRNVYLRACCASECSYVVGRALHELLEEEVSGTELGSTNMFLWLEV